MFEGLVQGVFFRANTRRCALERGLTGWVRNTADGRVEAVFEGEESEVMAAIDWCSKKQPYAKVGRTKIEQTGPTDEFVTFVIIP